MTKLELIRKAIDEGNKNLGVTPPVETPNKPRGYFVKNGEKFFEDVVGGRMRVQAVTKDYDQYKK